MRFDDDQRKALETLPFFNASAEGDRKFWDLDTVTIDMEEIGAKYAGITVALIREHHLYGLLGKIAESMDLEDYPSLREGFWRHIESMAVRGF